MARVFFCNVCLHGEFAGNFSPRDLGTSGNGAFDSGDLRVFEYQPPDALQAGEDEPAAGLQGRRQVPVVQNRNLKGF